MFRSTFAAIALFTVCLIGLSPVPVRAWQSDNGNGTFTNPVLNADYPDPDIIRVGQFFYMVSTTFADSPGLVILRSPDLVNWTLISHVAASVDGGARYDLVGGNGYRGGYWASSLRHRDGTFYVVVNPTFGNARVYHTNDITASGWAFHQLDRPAYDPGFFIDDDGVGYIVYGANSLSILTLNSTYSAVVAQTDNVVNTGGEGSHLLKRGAYYYLFNANPGVWPFQLLVSRATQLFGPWETGRVALTATTGGHQGAIVDAPDGTWWGFVHQDSGAVGRMPRVGPVFWENDWPVFGTTAARNQIPTTSVKPVAGQPLAQPATSDDFASTTLGLQWQWNHNPDPAKWSLTARAGHLRLRPTPATDFWTARNTLTQKGQGPRSHGVVRLDLSGLQSGDVAGFGTLGKVNGHIFVTANALGQKTLGMRVFNAGVGAYTAASGVPFAGNTLHLRTDLDFVRNLAVCSYSADGATWTRLGGAFPLGFDITHSTFQGQKFALFCYNPTPGAGFVDIDSFSFGDTAALVTVQRGRPINNGVTFVADNGQLMRGPFASTEWGNPPPQANLAAIKDLGLNAVHLYGEVFDPNYPAAGSTAPGYSASRIDQMVQMTRDLGLYLIITIGNGAANGAFNADYVRDFWTFYAPRYKNETHVLYEIQNEPHAWSAPYPQAALTMEADAYTLIRSHAPDTPILLFSFAVLGNGPDALADIRSVSTAASIDWTKAAVAFHGYAGYESTGTSLQAILAAGFPVFMTEFTSDPWGLSGFGAQDVELTAILERLGISWLSFLHVPPNFINSPVTDPLAHRGVIDRAGLSWVPDFGEWPRARGPFGNSGQHRSTTGLSGTLRLQAEDFDTGGQGVAYSDTDAANQGSQYRTAEGVDIQTTTDTGGGFNLTNLVAGEWLEYSIRVNEPGLHTLRLRVAGFGASTRAVRVLVGDEDVSGDWTLPSTGGTQTWTTVSRDVWLGFGLQKLRVEVVQPGFNLNWIELSPLGTGPIANGVYRLVNRNSGLAMGTLGGSNATNTTAVQRPYTGSADQQWTLTHLGAGNYRVSAFGNTRNLNIFGSEEAEIVPWWGGGTAQRFLLRPLGNGFHRLVLVGSGRSLEVASAATTPDAVVQQTTFTGGGHQQWAILSGSALAFPTNLTAAPSSTGGTTLTWGPASGATSYTVKRADTSGGPYTTLATGVLSTTYLDATAVAGARHYYVVAAQHPGGTSLDSAEAFAAPLRVHLRFDEASGTAAADASGLGWNGTLVNGAARGVGVLGNAVNLDGANDHTTLPTGVLVGLTDFTLSTWVNLDNVAMWSRIVDFGTSTSNYFYITPRSSGNVVRFSIRSTTTGEQTINGTAPLPAGRWVHVALTLANRTGILYVDGVEVGRNTGISLTPADLGATNRNYLGRSQFTNDPYIDGRIDDFRIYGGALSAASIAALASPPVTPPAAPTALTAIGGPATVALSWTAPALATTYTLKRSETAGSGYILLASGLTTTTYNDTTTLANKTYYYVVSAYNGPAEGPDSAPASASTHPSEVWLRFDDAAGTLAADSSGHAWHGTFVNSPSWVATTGVGAAVDLDGVNDHLALPDGVVSGLTDFTISAWVKLDALGNWSRLFDIGSGTTNYLFLTPRVGTTGNVRFAIRTPNVGEQLITGTAPLPTAVWTHVAVTRSGTLGTLYVNGIAVGSNNTLSLSPADLGRTTLNYIGRSQWAGDSYLDGQIAEFRIQDTALPAGQIATLASPPPSPTGLLAVAGDARVALSWSTGPDFVLYQVKRATTPGGPYTTLATALAAPGYTDPAVLNGTRYYYVVTATNPAGLPTNSVEVSARPTAPINAEESRPPALALVDGSLLATVRSSVVGHSYQVQYAEELAPAAWVNLGAPQTGNGGELVFTFTYDPAKPRQFYRVVITP